LICVALGLGACCSEEAIYEWSCESGDDASSCFVMGIEYSRNKSGPEAEEKAAQYFKMSCEGTSSGLGCFELAKMMQEGKGGLTRDEAWMKETFLQSCNEGYGLSEACLYAARDRLSQEGLEDKPRREAISWLRIACSTGEQPEACDLKAKYEGQPTP
jgi:TPR repeat protein